MTQHDENMKDLNEIANQTKEGTPEYRTNVLTGALNACASHPKNLSVEEHNKQFAQNICGVVTTEAKKATENGVKLGEADEQWTLRLVKWITMNEKKIIVTSTAVGFITGIAINEFVRESKEGRIVNRIFTIGAFTAMVIGAGVGCGIGYIIYKKCENDMNTTEKTSSLPAITQAVGMDINENGSSHANTNN